MEVRNKSVYVCINTRITTPHSASLVVEPCGETAAQLEHREMEENVNPQVTGNKHTYMYTQEIHEPKVSRSCSTPAMLLPSVSKMSSGSTLNSYLLIYY